jgi:hypothetical protein
MTAKQTSRNRARSKPRGMKSAVGGAGPAKLRHVPKAERLPQGAVEHAAELEAAARDITGAGPGDPAYEAIVNPSRGRPRKRSR